MNGPNALLVLPVSVRPRLAFVQMGGAAWVICRRSENGRYRWSARLHIDGDRRSTRKQDLAEWRAERRANASGHSGANLDPAQRPLRPAPDTLHRAPSDTTHSDQAGDPT